MTKPAKKIRRGERRRILAWLSGFGVASAIDLAIRCRTEYDLGLVFALGFAIGLALVGGLIALLNWLDDDDRSVIYRHSRENFAYLTLLGEIAQSPKKFKLSDPPSDYGYGVLAGLESNAKIAKKAWTL